MLCNQNVDVMMHLHLHSLSRSFQFDVLFLNTPPNPKTQMVVPPKLAKVSDDGGGLRLLYGIPKGVLLLSYPWRIFH
jgi:hypothetical protein